MQLNADQAKAALDDDEAMSRVQCENDHGAFTCLVEKWERPIRNLCLRMTGDFQLSEDLKQETFCRLYQKRDEYRSEGKFSGFLWMIAKNLCYDEIRKRKRQTRVWVGEQRDYDSPMNPGTSRKSPHQLSAQKEEAEIVREAIQALPQIYREVIVLRHYQNLKRREIAEVLEVPLGTVNSRLAMALGLLFAWIEPYISRMRLCVSISLCLNVAIRIVARKDLELNQLRCESYNELFNDVRASTPSIHMITTNIIPFVVTFHRSQVIVLWKTVFGYEAGHNNPSLVIDKKVAVGDGLFFVAMSDNTVVGTIMAGYDGHRGWIYSLAVSPSHRRQRIGSRLVLAAEQALIDRGCMKINLQIMAWNESVASFYSGLGFSVEKRVSMGKQILENVPAS